MIVQTNMKHSEEIVVTTEKPVDFIQTEDQQNNRTEQHNAGKEQRIAWNLTAGEFAEELLVHHRRLPVRKTIREVE